MALPSRPSPRARLGAARPTRQADYDDYDQYAAPSTQRSAPTGFRDRPAAAPAAGSSLRSSRNAAYNDQDGSSRSSQASSFMKPSGSSSRTSVDDDYDYSHQPKRPVQESYNNNNNTANEGGIWGRVASAAGSLTVNVGKAWSANVTFDSGEMTPPGKESRVTKVLRQYYLDRARDPSDLPTWLFDESERRAGGRSTTASRYNNPEPRDDRYSDQAPSAPAPRRGGLRDMYESATTSRDDYAPPSRSAGYADEPASSSSSRAADRLRALRDAKRGTPSRRAAEPEPEPEPIAEPVYSGRRMMPPRQGLPVGPGRVRRE